MIALPGFMCRIAARAEEVPEDVGFERPLELLVGDVLDGRLVLLKRRVVDENIQPSEFGNGFLDGADAEGRLPNVTRDQNTPRPFMLDRGSGLDRIALFRLGVHDGDIGPFACKKYSDRTANSRIATGDQRRLTGELARPTIARGEILRPRPHLGFDAGFGLMLFWEWRFGPAPCGARAGAGEFALRVWHGSVC